MKMYHFRAIASFVLAIFLTTLSVVLIAWACDELKGSVAYLKEAVVQQRKRVTAIEESGYMASISEGASWGMGIGAGVGLAEAAATGPLSPATAIPHSYSLTGSRKN